MYMEKAEEEDKKLAESWQADADGILIFVRLSFLVPCLTLTYRSQTGLFSAGVALFTSVSIQDIRPNPQDTSNFYLANIYQATLADPSQSNISSSLPTSPPPFSPPTYAVWVNALWFMSLVISITCALLATLLQGWARRYLKVTQTRSSLHKRARIRSFFAQGVQRSHLSMIVEVLPTLIHIAVYLFFSGLAVLLWNVNLTIFTLVLSWISVCTALYGCITLIPMFRHNSPYYSPLTEFARPVIKALLYVFGLLYLLFYALLFSWSTCSKHCSGLVRIFGLPFSWFVHIRRLASMTPDEALLKSSSDIDTHAFTWTFDCLDEDEELDRFFSGLPGFHNSRVLKEPLHDLDDQQKLRLLEAAIRLLDRTLSSNVLSDQARRRRADICTTAIDFVLTPGAYPKLVRNLASEDQYGPTHSTEILDFIRRWDNRKGEDTEDTALVQAMFSIVVARVHRHDDSWFNLASKELGIPEAVLREYAANGDSLSLAILIYVTRLQFTHIRNPSWPSKAISKVLRAASKNINAQDTSPELQHEFCALWNEIHREANKGTSEIPEYILGPIRNPYITLHRGTNSAPTRFSSTTADDNPHLWDEDAYPMCKVSDHVRSDSASTTFVSNVPHDDAVPSPASLASLVVPSLPSLAPLHVDNSLATAPPPNNSYPTHQFIEDFRIPFNSPDSATADPDFKKQKEVIATQAPQPAPEASVPLVDVLLQPNTIPLTPPATQTFPSPASSAPALDNILHTGPSLFFLFSYYNFN